MIKNKAHGWGEIKIGNWSDRISDINDVPVELMNAVSRTCSEWGANCVWFDAEGWDYIIIFTPSEVHIITEDEKTGKSKLGTIEVSIVDLAKELLNDIQSDFDGWAMWDYEINDKDQPEMTTRRQWLQLCCDDLQTAINLKSQLAS